MRPKPGDTCVPAPNLDSPSASPRRRLALVRFVAVSLVILGLLTAVRLALHQNQHFSLERAPPREVPDTSSALRVTPRQEISSRDGSPESNGIAPAFLLTDGATSRTVIPAPTMRLLPRPDPTSAHPETSVRQVVQQAEPETSEPLPMPQELLRLPLHPDAERKNISLSATHDRISLSTTDASLGTVLSMLAEQHGLNVIAAQEMPERICVRLADTSLPDALDVLLSTHGYTWVQKRNVLIVSKIGSENKLSAEVQGRELRVFSLNYVAAEPINTVVKGLLSPVGQSFSSQSMSSDYRRASEQLVVEDLPENIRRIEGYLTQVDRPPRQVLIEAHVLQVALKDNCRHGVDLQQALRISNTQVTLMAAGFATGTAPASTMTIQGGDLNGLLEAIKATTDSKTLAAPKVAVLNNQEASMQVGSKIGYLLTTTTQTSTLQSVNFLDVGVILKVRPSITDDGQIMIDVKPQVSTGRINGTTQLPESETTEVQTRVMLGDGEAIVIGGLIKEADIDNQNKIPFLGDLWLVGWLFQRREVTRERNEIIVTLLPRIIPDGAVGRNLDPLKVDQAHTPLFQGPLCPVDRRQYEPQLPCYDQRRPFRFRRAWGWEDEFSEPAPPHEYAPHEYAPHEYPSLDAPTGEIPLGDRPRDEVSPVHVPFESAGVPRISTSPTAWNSPAPRQPVAPAEYRSPYLPAMPPPPAVPRTLPRQIGNMP